MCEQTHLCPTCCTRGWEHDCGLCGGTGRLSHAAWLEWAERLEADIAEATWGTR